MASPDMRRDIGPESKEIPGRSLLEKHADLADKERRPFMKGERPGGQTIEDENGHEAWRKEIHYVREPDPNREGKWRDTDEVKAITERKFTRDDQGRVTKTEGTNLDREHSYLEATKYDDVGNVANESGEVTEGEKQGENWNREYTQEQKGDYVKHVMTETGKRLKDSKLVDYQTVRVNYNDGTGKNVWGHQESVVGGEKEAPMEWGEKPADLEE
ncbi:hypothetical protein ACFL0L_01910 [Patescibacteria group bacterium]